MPDRKQDKVFVTGATGFIGSHVARFFCDKDVEVICGVRPSSDLSFLKTLPVSFRFIDLLDKESIFSEIKDCNAVIHTAGLVNDWSSYQDFYNTNVLGTKNLMEACVSAGIKKVIVTGSSASYGEEDSSELKSEHSTEKPRYPYFLEQWIPNRMNHYRVTKNQAILKAVEIAKKHMLNLTVIEPVWVYGEREFSSGFFEYMKVISSGIPFFPGCKYNHFHVIYAGELAKAYFLTYETNPEGIHRMLIGNTKIDRMEKIYTLFCKELGIRKPMNLPKALVYPFGLLIEIFAELLRTKNPPLLSRARVNMMYDNITYNTAKAEHLIAFKAEVPIETGIAKTVQWYKSKHLI